MKKLLLINPVGRRTGYLKSRFSTFSPLGLAYVAAVTPSDWHIKVIDENFETFEFEEADLVGITAFTSNINRGYEIANLYRKRKTKVVMGGIHASMIPEEVMKYTDSVVIGEVEGIWQKVIKDFENNNLSPKYIGPKIDFEHFKIIPRRDLLHSNYLWQSVQTSRGCPFKCEFCSVSRYLGETYRCRNAEDVLEEIKGINSKYIFFTDDNLIGYNTDSISRAKQLFKGMIKYDLNKRWWMQASINSADDEEVIELAAKAGCMFVFVGFETISLKTLKGMKKGVNIKTGVNNYRRVVDTFHKYGIGILGGFIIGNDYETPEYYKQLSNFIIQSNIDMIQLSILTPLPGTKLMEHLKEENRLVYRKFPQDWDKFRFSYVVYLPHEIDERTIYIGDNYIKKRLYNFPTFPIRLFKSFFYLKNFEKFFAVYKLNQALKTSWQNAQYYNTYPKIFE